MSKIKTIRFDENGWDISCRVDSDGHLNIYIKNADGTDILDCETGQGDGQNGEALAIRLSTAAIEETFSAEQDGSPSPR